MSPEVGAALVAALVSVVTTLVTGHFAHQRTKADYKLEFAAEAVARKLLSNKKWQWRSFSIIKHHLGGFEDDELRKLLVRAGAVRIRSDTGEELWGLLSRNPEGMGSDTVSEPFDRPRYSPVRGG